MSDRILIVDDEDVVRRVLRNKLEACGFEVYEAGDGNKALTYLAETCFDLIITDVLMPGKDGLGLLMQLRRDKVDIPVIAIPAAEPLYLDNAEHFGAIRTFSKPFGVNDVAAAVKEILNPS